MSSGRVVRFSKSVTINMGDYNSVRLEAELQEPIGADDNRIVILKELQADVEKFLERQVRKVKQ